ncbi:MAG TPA: hypothetical protein VKE74_08520 [Gemmataceae bacterium]|nr:hypothetical protein [Gemmataceae bacterium]
MSRSWRLVPLVSLVVGGWSGGRPPPAAFGPAGRDGGYRYGVTPVGGVYGAGVYRRW